ncbi:hypothetical protein DFS33DRAFT_735927 [Desarmillaria ectypa]|nr:hypothetical protein DFS33DRAFT_735927 [Desarmillaria ectypa]
MTTTFTSSCLVNTGKEGVAVLVASAALALAASIRDSDTLRVQPGSLLSSLSESSKFATENNKLTRCLKSESEPSPDDKRAFSVQHVSSMGVRSGLEGFSSVLTTFADRSPNNNLYPECGGDDKAERTTFCFAFTAYQRAIDCRRTQSCFRAPKSASLPATGVSIIESHCSHG